MFFWVTPTVKLYLFGICDLGGCTVRNLPVALNPTRVDTRSGPSELDAREWVSRFLSFPKKKKKKKSMFS